MQLHHTVASLRSALENETDVGFVPTMGALHPGHLSLVDRARRECSVVVMSVFVNPLQFGPTEDFEKYPRPTEQDAQLAEEAGVDLLFVPSSSEMYPLGKPATTVNIAGLTASFEGARRPGHLDGVATVVTKLFAIVGPTRAYFGEKDWQQLAVVKRLTHDLSLPVEVLGCPIVREADGLAMSSRNHYLDDAHRKAALVLNRSLQRGAELLADGETSVEDVRKTMWRMMTAEPLVQPDYAEIVDAELQRVLSASEATRLLVAAQVGPARLIDNMAVGERRPGL